MPAPANGENLRPNGRYVEYNVILNEVNIIKQAIPCQASIISKKV